MADNPDNNIKKPSAGSGTGRGQMGPGNGAPARAEASDWVGDKLKELYGEVVREPLPENLLALLRELDERDSPKD